METVPFIVDLPIEMMVFHSYVVHHRVKFQYISINSPFVDG
jgi:hypothetical protein